MLLLVVYVLTISIIIFLSLAIHGREKYGSLEACGIPVVPPSLFLGSEPDFHKKIHHLEDVKRLKKYGPIWGVR